METVDRVGPCESKINVENITDVRVEKRQKIVERAKELMRDWVVKDGQEIEKLLDEVQKEDKKIKAVHYGRERLTATPDISKSDEIIIVEGRADVNNLIKSGVTGVIAMEGVKVPKTIRNLTSRKEVTAFLDGDRGGDLILQELMQVAPPTYVARAPRGKEVEELSPEEIDKALDAKRPLEDAKAKPEPEEKAPRFSEEIVNLTNDLRGTLEAVLIKTDGKQDERIPVSELVEKLKDANDVKLVVFDGIVTGRLIDTAREKNIDTIIGERVAEGVRIPRGVEVRSFKNLN